MKPGDLVKTVRKICDPMIGEGKVGILIADQPRVVEGMDEMVLVFIDGKQYFEFKENLESLNA